MHKFPDQNLSQNHWIFSAQLANCFSRIDLDCSRSEYYTGRAEVGTPARSLLLKALAPVVYFWMRESGMSKMACHHAERWSRGFNIKSRKHLHRIVALDCSNNHLKKWCGSLWCMLVSWEAACQNRLSISLLKESRKKPLYKHKHMGQNMQVVRQISCASATLSDIRADCRAAS